MPFGPPPHHLCRRQQHHRPILLLPTTTVILLTAAVATAIAMLLLLLLLSVALHLWSRHCCPTLPFLPPPNHSLCRYSRRVLCRYSCRALRCTMGGFRPVLATTPPHRSTSQPFPDALLTVVRFLNWPRRLAIIHNVVRAVRRARTTAAAVIIDAGTSRVHLLHISVIVILS